MGSTFTNFYYTDPSSKFRERHDAVEIDPKHAEVFASIDEEVEDELKNHPRSLGFIHLVWGTKQRILKQKYGIPWRSPAELNPGNSYD